MKRSRGSKSQIKDKSGERGKRNLINLENNIRHLLVFLVRILLMSCSNVADIMFESCPCVLLQLAKRLREESSLLVRMWECGRVWEST
jgi:hypothetical protein